MKRSTLLRIMYTYAALHRVLKKKRVVIGIDKQWLDSISEIDRLSGIQSKKYVY
jgi:hypothetical protein